MVKRIFAALLMTGVIVSVTTSMPASQAAEQGDSRQEGQSIVGSWFGTLDNGERIVMSFTADGINFSSVQSEVSLSKPVLTPSHGVWTRLGGRQFATTN